ncbi:MAG: site-specific integrase [Steroidobacteraceae bacterium]
MAAIRERKKADGTSIYHVQVRMAGFPSRTASFPTKRQAERWGKTIEAEMIEGKHFRTAEARRRSVAAAIDRYIEEEIPKKRDGSMHRVCLPWWRDKIGGLKLADVTPAILVEYRGKLGRETYMRAKPGARRSELPKGEKPKLYTRSNSTVNRYLASLSHVFTVARKEWHWIGHDPFDGVTLLRENKGRVRYLSDEERTKLLAETAKDRTLHCLVVLALSTAARAGELLKLLWRDVDLKEGRLLFRITKNAEPRAVWLHGEALRLIKERSKVRELHNSSVFPGVIRGTYDYKKPFANALEAAGILDFRFHDLRHSAATYLAMQGASEQQLRAVGGWKSGIVSRYVHLAATDAKEALAKLSAKVDSRESN